MSSEGPVIDPDRYLTLDKGPEVEIKVRGSRFIAQAFAARDAGEAERVLKSLRRRYHDATHHCSAWRVGPPEAAEERGDDDGEPSGTAGAPILAALRGQGLVNALCVVTRYYGGTKLGTGGLARAYGDAARAGIESAPRRWVERLVTLRIALPYESLGALETTLSREANLLRGVERSFDPDPVVEVRVLQSHAERLGAVLVEATAGRAKVSRG